MSTSIEVMFFLERLSDKTMKQLMVVSHLDNSKWFELDLELQGHRFVSFLGICFDLLILIGSGIHF